MSSARFEHFIFGIALWVAYLCLTQRRGDKRIAEDNTFLGNAVDVRRRNAVLSGASCAAQRIPAEVVHEDENDVGSVINGGQA